MDHADVPAGPLVSQHARRFMDRLLPAQLSLFHSVQRGSPGFDDVGETCCSTFCLTMASSASFAPGAISRDTT